MLVTQAEFAKLKSVTASAVSQWKKEGRLVVVGRAIDLEATERRLLTESRFHSKRIKPAAAISVKLSTQPPELNTKPARYADGAIYDNPANLPEEAVVASSAIADGAYDLVAVLVGRLPMTTIVDLVREWIARQRRGWVGGPGLPDSLCDEDWPPPPVGFTHWCEHPLFARDPVKEVDWHSLSESFPEHTESMPI